MTDAEFIANPRPDTERAIQDTISDALGSAISSSVRDIADEIGAAAGEAYARGVRAAEDDFVRAARMQVLTSGAPSTLIDPYSARAMSLTGEIVDGMRLEAVGYFQESIGAGTTPKGIMDGLDTLFGRWIDTGRQMDPPPGNVVSLQATSRLETIVRTEFAQAYNAGRNALMTDPDVDVVVGLENSSILDHRTTDLCVAWDGIIFDPKDRDAIAKYGPPGHFQCRRELIPVTKWDGLQPTPRSEWPKGPDGKILAPMPGFGGTA